MLCFFSHIISDGEEKSKRRMVGAWQNNGQYISCFYMHIQPKFIEKESYKEKRLMNNLIITICLWLIHTRWGLEGMSGERTGWTEVTDFLELERKMVQLKLGSRPPGF